MHDSMTLLKVLAEHHADGDIQGWGNVAATKACQWYTAGAQSMSYGCLPGHSASLQC